MSFDTHLDVADVVTFLAHDALVDGIVTEVISDDLHDIESYTVAAGDDTFVVYADEVTLMAQAA